jgi:ribosome-binding factor A
VAQLIQQELARMLVEEVKDPRVGFVTITEVRVTADLKSARVFVSVYGSREQQEASMIGLQAASGFLKREMGHRLRLKYTPELTFVFDDTLDRAQRLDDIIDAISAGATEPPESSQAPALPVQTNRSELFDRRRQFADRQPQQESRRTRRRRADRRRR